jgi:osmotically-inducible protein OsmY
MIDISRQDVQPRAQAALQTSSIVALREVRVQESEGALRLSGRVSSFYHKQLAQEVVLAVASGMEVVNQIDVH